MAVAPITTPEQAVSARRATPARRRTRLGGRRGPRAEDGNPRENPPIVTVYFHTDGELHHGWCGHPLEFHGTRAGLEMDFFCIHCVEHVTLPNAVLPRIPIGPPLV
jgi:hypothetical protein